MGRKKKDGQRRRFSFRYDPRVFTRLESIYSQAGISGESAEQTAFHDNQQFVKDLLSLMLLGYTQGAILRLVFIREGHTLVCGIPQKSGKTTCIERLLSRWPGNEHRKKKIIAFILKQEAVFSDFRKIRPYINTNPDPDFLSLIVESMLVNRRTPQISKKINLIMAEICHNTKSLKEVLKNATKMQKKAEHRDRLKRDACKIVKHYLSEIFPQCQNAGFGERLEFNDYNNLVIDLSQFSEQIQTLVMGSVAYEVLNHHQDTILVVPDAWTMFDREYSMGRFHIESLIERGPYNRNHVIIEAAGIEDTPPHIRSQVSTILLGYQLWEDEARAEIRALRGLASNMRKGRMMKGVEKPFLNRLDIQRLKIGEFYAFPSSVEEQGVWKANKVAISPQTRNEEAVKYS